MSETNTPVTPAAAPAVNSTVGLKHLVIAPVTLDTEEETTYGALQLVAGAIDASITPSNADAEVQYFDDNEGDVVQPDPDVAFKIKLADVALPIRAMLLGETTDKNGVLISKAGDKATYFAVGFKALKSNGKYRYVWLYKCRCNPITESFQTKEGTTITRQTTDCEFVAVKRASDELWKAVADEGVGGFTPEDGETFLDTVYEPDFGD